MPSASDHARELDVQPELEPRHVTGDYDPRTRFGLYRLCDCIACDGKGKVNERDSDGEMIERRRCRACRGEGRVRQEVASCDSPEAVGVALVTLAWEGEWEKCPFGLLDREGEKGKKWLVLPWLPSPRNVSDAGRVLRQSQGAVGPLGREWDAYTGTFKKTNL